MVMVRCGRAGGRQHLTSPPGGHRRGGPAAAARAVRLDARSGRGWVTTHDLALYGWLDDLRHPPSWTTRSSRSWRRCRAWWRARLVSTRNTATLPGSWVPFGLVE